jgi:hypothetical protein
MDGTRFDGLARSLAAGTDRRRFVRGLAAGLGAALGLSSLRRKAAANHGGSHGGGPKPGRCGQPGQPCKWGTQCCSGTCLNGVCLCHAGQTNCGGACVACPVGGVCVGTTCGCPEGQVDCAGVCRTARDEACETDDDCCGTDACVPVGLDRECRACVAEPGGSCFLDSCCPGLTCQDNVCV